MKYFEIAKTFNKEIEEQGYETMIYSSKNFLKYAYNYN